MKGKPSRFMPRETWGICVLVVLTIIFMALCATTCPPGSSNQVFVKYGCLERRNHADVMKAGSYLSLVDCR